MRLAKLRSKRAISPIIATVLLIAITIAAGLAIYGWVSGLMSAGTSSKLTGTTSLTLSVENTSTNAATILIANEGSYDVNLGLGNFQLVASNGAVVSNFPLAASNGASVTIDVPAGSTNSATISSLVAGTYTLKIVDATDVQGNTVIANSVTFTVT